MLLPTPPWPLEHQECECRRCCVGNLSSSFIPLQEEGLGLQRCMHKGTDNRGQFYTLVAETEASCKVYNSWGVGMQKKKIIPIECGHGRRWVTAASPRETPEGPSKTLTSSCYFHTGVKYKVHRAKRQERIASPSVPGPASCCFHCTLPAKAICLASTKPVWRSGPHRASGSFTNHHTSSRFLLLFIFLITKSLSTHLNPSFSLSVFLSLPPSLSLHLLACSYLKQDAVAVYPSRAMCVQVVLLCGML